MCEVGPDELKIKSKAVPVSLLEQAGSPGMFGSPLDAPDSGIRLRQRRHTKFRNIRISGSLGRGGKGHSGSLGTLPPWTRHTEIENLDGLHPDQRDDLITGHCRAAWAPIPIPIQSPILNPRSCQSTVHSPQFTLHSPPGHCSDWQTAQHCCVW